MTRLKRLAAPPHPTWQSAASRARVERFLEAETRRVPTGWRLNVGSASRRVGARVLNLDLLPGPEVDLRADILHLPIKSQSVDTLVCTGVLEHVPDAHRAVDELYRVLSPGGGLFVEVPFMQTVHASPSDYARWTRDGLTRLLRRFEVRESHVVAGPASGLAWAIQETLAMLFSFRSDVLYRVGLRLFGWLAVPISWLDRVLEGHPMAWRAASGFAVVAAKPQHDLARQPTMPREGGG